MPSTLHSFSAEVDRYGTGSALSVTFHQRGRKARRADFLVEDPEGGRTSFTLRSPEDALRLARFLENAATAMPAASTQPDYSITGYRLKVMSFGKKIARFSCSLNEQHCGFESFSYEGFRRQFPSYDSDDYYFILYPCQERGLCKDTIETIVDACASYQQAVIVSGDMSLFRPMRLKDIADKTGYDLSTISRACEGACIYTAHRNYSLDNENSSYTFVGLFNQGVDSEVSAHAVRDKIKDIIDTEDKLKPLTDEAIMARLTKFGFYVARRTVVKYREQLGYPNSRERKIRLCA